MTGGDLSPWPLGRLADDRTYGVVRAIPLGSLPLGELRFLPEPDGNGSPYASFTFQVQDDGGTAYGGADLDPSPNVMSINVTAVNDAPIGTDDSLSSVTEDSSERVIPFGTLLANDFAGPANESSQTLTIIAVSGAVGGMVSIDGTDVRFTPAADFNGEASFSYTLQDDGQTNSVDDFLPSSAVVSFTVTAVNDAPIGTDDSLSSVVEDSGERVIPFGTLLANDSVGPANESNQTLTITAVSGAVGGTVSIVGTDVHFTPAADFNGEASFTYTLQDNGQTNGVDDFLTSSAVVNFTVTEVNDAPSGTNDTLSSVAEDSGERVIPFGTLLANDSTGLAYESGQTLSVIAVSGAVGGTVSIVGTDVHFTPAADFNGIASFSYTLQDDGQTNGVDDFLTSSAVVSFTVSALNDAPSGTNDLLSSVAEDSSERVIPFGTLLANDSVGPANESGQTLTIIAVGGAADGTVSIDGTDVRFTPAADFNGEASFTYTLQDDGQTNGVDDFLTSSAVVSFTVTAVNDAPSGTDDSLSSVAEDSGERSIPFATLLANDSVGPVNESGQTLTIIAVSGAVGGMVSIVGTDVRFTPAADFNGEASFTYSLQDNGQTNGVDDFLTSTAVVSFTVTAVNDAPSGTDDSLSSVAEDSGERSIPFATLLANDSVGPANEGDQALTIIAVSGTVGGTVSIVGTDVRFIQAADFNGEASFTYSLQDNGQTNGVDDFLTSTAEVSFTVTAVNDAPSGTDDSLSGVTEDSSERVIPFGTLSANDSVGPANESGQTLTITAVSGAVGGTVSIVGTDVRFTPAADFNGTASFSYTSQDNGQTNGVDDFLTSTAEVSFTISAVDDNPFVATAITDVTVAEDAADTVLDLSATFDDVDIATNGDGLTLSVVNSNPSLLTASFSGTTLTLDYAAEQNGTTTITVRATDAGGLWVEDSFLVTVNAVNDAPSFNIGGNVTVTEDSGAYSAAHAASITDGDLDRVQSLSFAVSNTNNGLFSVQPALSAVGVLMFTPATNASGSATLSVTLTDDATAGGAAITTAVQTFTITVQSAQTQFVNLITIVNSLGLVPQDAAKLVDKLQTALTFLNNGKTTPAINHIQNAFINQVNAFVNSGKLTQAQANVLITAANAAVASIGTGGTALLTHASSAESGSAVAQPVTTASLLVSDTLWVALESGNGNLTAEHHAGLQTAIIELNGKLGSYGVALEELNPENGDRPDIRITVSASSDCGGAADGVLGCAASAGNITLISGWNWYTGAASGEIGIDQYDFGTIITHELAHAVGLNHSHDSNSVMYEMLATGQIRRTLTADDLVLLEEEGTGPEALLAAPPAKGNVDQPMLRESLAKQFIGNHRGGIHISTDDDLNHIAADTIFGAWRSLQSNFDRYRNRVCAGISAGSSGSQSIVKSDALAHAKSGINRALNGDAGLDLFFAELDSMCGDDSHPREKIDDASVTEFSADLSPILKGI